MTEDSGAPANFNSFSTSSASELSWTNEDLIELIRAIKFSDKNASIRQVHKEITTQMALHPSFEFLSQVQLNQVKKVWKKALQGGKDDLSQANSSTDFNSNGNSNQILQFYTVGDGSVQMLAQRYTMTVASQLAEKETNQNREEENSHGNVETSFVHCFLDMPADKTGMKPYQALINFNKGSGSGYHASKKSQAPSTIKSSPQIQIVKIQVAAPIAGIEHTPMLLYNQSRTIKTFIHPPDDNHDDDRHHEQQEKESYRSSGYQTIKTLILTSGTKGVLANGGHKAYFYAEIIPNPDKDSPDILQIDVSKLAPLDQVW